MIAVDHTNHGPQAVVHVQTYVRDTRERATEQKRVGWVIIF